MKISKKDLRRIILENLFQENNRGIILESAVNLNRAWRAASKFKKNPDDEAREELERFRERLEDNKNAVPPTGPFRKDKGRALEAQALLDDIIALLDAKSGEAATVDLAPEPSPDASADGTDGDTPSQPSNEKPSGDLKIYKYGGKRGDDGYDYKVDQDSGCWMARKGSNGNWFSMKKYPENMWNLDQKFQEARTDEQKKKCQNRKPGSSGSTSNTTGKLGEIISGLVSGGMLDVATSSRLGPALANDNGEQVAFVGSSGFDMVHEDLGGGGTLEGVDSGYVIVQKEKSGQPGPDNKTLAAAVFYITSRGVKGFYVDENLKKIGTINDESFTTDDYNSKGSTAGLGIDATVIQKILNNLKRRKQSMISESKQLSEVRTHIRRAINEIMVGLTPITRIDNANDANSGEDTNTAIDKAELGFNTFDMQEWASIAGIDEKDLSEALDDDTGNSSMLGGSDSRFDNVVDIGDPNTDSTDEIPGMVVSAVSGDSAWDDGLEDEVEDLADQLLADRETQGVESLYDFSRFLV